MTQKEMSYFDVIFQNEPWLAALTFMCLGLVSVIDLFFDFLLILVPFVIIDDLKSRRFEL